MLEWSQALQDNTHIPHLGQDVAYVSATTSSIKWIYVRAMTDISWSPAYHYHSYFMTYNYVTTFVIGPVLVKGYKL